MIDSDFLTCRETYNEEFLINYKKFYILYEEGEWLKAKYEYERIIVFFYLNRICIMTVFVKYYMNQ
jgi:hypothetical protein